ncbi:hypothetical protein [Vibrio phage vB_VmeM-Yong XC32]|nr:hypothetical protein [Vibrio phage vB_VmeM-Yong XC31]QAX96383.1 hypothetical protein [Vibrio phage vB_VmeM-Yong XC32]QAX96701.1 hypothetical protein [Vibrio phage vB_VmeM-Yong MS31]QAX97019.1 hypothetical protein [Vibrio phage vB_VmeM-Yong MS32]
MTINDLVTGGQHRFTIYGSISGRKQFEGTIAAIIGGQFVPQTSNADTNHINIYPTLSEDRKARFLDDYASYDYVQLALADGSMVYIGLPWIIDNTIESLGDTRLDVQIKNFDEGDYDKFRLWVNQGGWEISSMAIVRN